MHELNSQLKNVEERIQELRQVVNNLLIDYEDLYREVNNRFVSERLTNGKISGLEDFYRLVQLLRRNRNVLGSLVRGVNNIHSTSRFRFIEEEISEESEKLEEPKKQKKSKKANATSVSVEG